MFTSCHVLKLQESKNELEATLRRQQNERKTLDHQYRKVISDKIKVEEQLTKLQEHLRDSNSADELTRMEADVTRFVSCPDRAYYAQ